MTCIIGLCVRKPLAAALSAPPGDGGLWTGKVAAWISETLQRRVSKYLKRLGYTLQTPRPQHQAAATPEAQQTFKKKLKERVASTLQGIMTNASSVLQSYWIVQNLPWHLRVNNA